MDIQISDKKDDEYSSSVNLTIGKKSAFVSLCKIFPGRVNVLCKNSSHAVWRGCGRFFGSWELALDGYKSSAMKAAIETAREELDPAPVEAVEVEAKDPRDTDFDEENAGMEAALAGEARDETQGRDWLSGWDLGHEVETDPREYAPENDPRGPIWAANGCEWPPETDLPYPRSARWCANCGLGLAPAQTTATCPRCVDAPPPSLQDEGDAVAEPVHLIGHGLHPAVFVSQLLPGDVLAFNGPTFSTVVDVSPVPSKSGAFATLTTTSKGVVYQSRKRRDGAIAFVEHGAAPVLSGPLPQDHPRAWRKLSIRTLAEAPSQSFPLKHPTPDPVPPSAPSSTPWKHDQVGARQPLRPLKADPQAKIADESEAYTRGRLPEGLTIREIPPETFRPDGWNSIYDTAGHGGRRDFYRTVDDLLHDEKGLAETITGAQLDRYVAAYLDWMTRRNSVPNWAIAGPAKFDYRKRDKMGHAADNAFKRFKDVQTSIRRQCARAAREAHVADAGGPIELLRTEIVELEKLSALMKGANKVVRRKPKNVSTADKLEELVALGMKSTVAAKLFVEDFARRFGFPGYQLSGARADIRRKAERIAELEKREAASGQDDVEHRFDEVKATVTLCYSQDRIKIRHDTKALGLAAKPELRRHGFLWSPASGAWQRMLSTNGAWHAGLALGVTVPG